MTYPVLDFQVPSSSTGEVYEVVLSRTDNNLTMTCTCPAGTKGMHCKHRLSILLCDFSDVESGDTDREGDIKEMLSGSDVEAAWEEVFKFEEELTALKSARATDWALTDPEWVI